MWRAALSHMVLVGAALMALLAPSAGARSSDATAASALPRPLWALDLGGSAAASSSALRSYRAQGFNAVLTHSRRSKRSATSLRRRASGARLLHLRSHAAKPAACRALKRRYGRCVLMAPSLRAALRLARSPAVSLVVVRLGSLGELQSLSGRSRGRILALGRLDGARYDLSAWTEAAVLATNDPLLDLGVSASSARRGVAAQRFGDDPARVHASQAPSTASTSATSSATTTSAAAATATATAPTAVLGRPRRRLRLRRGLRRLCLRLLGRG